MRVSTTMAVSPEASQDDGFLKGRRDMKSLMGWPVTTAGCVLLQGVVLRALLVQHFAIKLNLSKMNQHNLRQSHAITNTAGRIGWTQ